ncbi:hypothetical protein [Methanoplanus limicola]|uniref:Uncharacterized protein n=1 Tax=Methanoplanus limicola DSM 2279 TaxID=937775 RepID=H1Z4L6_9EURY|nr:hypothetical protein [Methanoplanus limicola]EHQ36764.1 hypothetical protein Metlim_2729 [Methanoplanus limicola DSM 2279]
MSKKYKIAISAILLLLIFAISCILIIGFIGSSGSGGKMQLSEIPEEKLDTIMAPTIEISGADFKKYPELKELFYNINTSSGEFVSEIYVRPGRYGEIYHEYVPGILHYNESYYTILAMVP